jgi:RNA polymerase sigma-70 factor, ECF subfamily
MYKMAIDVAGWYERYGPMVIRRCRRILGNEEEALDAVQDVFLNLIRAEAKLRDLFPSSLLYTMATNVCLNRLRKKKREVLSGFSDSNEFFVLDEGFEQVEAGVLLEAILRDESEENRTIFYMYHADGMTLKEIGEVVGLSVSGVRKRLEAFKSRILAKI